MQLLDRLRPAAAGTVVEVATAVAAISAAEVAAVVAVILVAAVVVVVILVVAVAAVATSVEVGVADITAAAVEGITAADTTEEVADIMVAAFGLGRSCPTITAPMTITTTITIIRVTGPIGGTRAVARLRHVARHVTAHSIGRVERFSATTGTVTCAPTCGNPEQVQIKRLAILDWRA